MQCVHCFEALFIVYLSIFEDPSVCAHLHLLCACDELIFEKIAVESIFHEKCPVVSFIASCCLQLHSLELQTEGSEADLVAFLYCLSET